MHPPTFDTFSDSAQARAACEELFTGKFIHVAGVGWLEWTGKVWREVPEKVPLDALRSWTERKLAAVVSAANCEGTSPSSLVLKAWRKRLEGPRLRSALGLLEGFPGVSVDSDQLDASPDVLNCRNGVVYLPFGDLMSHAPGMYLTKYTDTDYKPTAIHEDWNKALTALPADVADWMQTRLGQGITGHMCPDDRVIIQQGGGRNGKSTVLAGVAAALGDYYFMASDKILIGSQAGAHTTDLADLRGARLVAVEETPEAGRLDVQRLKRLAGTERITARKMRQDNVSFPATHTLFVNTNHLPVIAETDDATWERLLLVVYPFKFAEEPDGDNQRSKDTRLRDRLRSAPQREAVLAWLVEGSVRYYADGARTFPPVPPVVLEDTERWRNASDLVATFWADHLDSDPHSYIYAGDLIWMFNQFLVQHGNSRVAESTFVRRFAHHRITAGSLVTHQRLRQARTPLRQSRPIGALDPFSRLPGCPQGQVMAWVGIRFRPAGDLGGSELGVSAGQYQSEQGEQGNFDGA